MDQERTRCPRLWISYPWIGREEIDFSYLVSLLRESEIDAVYDSLQLDPDNRLSQRIEQRLLSIEFDGWLYILTHQLLKRKACADELVSAIDQAQRRLGAEFPIVGLLHGVSAQNVPAFLRVKPCFSLGDGDWRCRILAALMQPTVAKKTVRQSEEMRFRWRIHPSYEGNPYRTAIEVAPANESIIQCWRFAVPLSASIISWGVGPAGAGGHIAPVKFLVARGTGRYGTSEVAWFGAANPISITESAYAVIAGPLPDFVCFGPAQIPSGPPGQMEVFWPARMKGGGNRAA